MNRTQVDNLSPCTQVPGYSFSIIKNTTILFEQCFYDQMLLLLFATTRFVVKLVEVAECTNRSHWIRHRSSGDKSVGCVLQANKCLTDCGSSPQDRCRLVRRTPYACSPAVDGSVLIVAVRECSVDSGSVSAPRLSTLLLLRS